MKIITFGLLLFGIAVCRPFTPLDNFDSNTIINVSPKTPAHKPIHNSSTFRTTKSINVLIETRDNDGNILKNTPFNLLLTYKNNQGSLFLMSATTNTEGVFTTKIELEPTAERLIAVTNEQGSLIYQTAILDNSDTITLSFGAENAKKNYLADALYKFSKKFEWPF